jgi:hypothetical protein
MPRDRKPHNLELPIIAQAIEEYRNSCMTQKQCAEKYNIPIKVFSYYFLNGFKKRERMAGTGTAGIQTTQSTSHKPKAKQRENYLVELIPAQNQTQQIQTNPQVTIAPPTLQQPIQQPQQPQHLQKHYHHNTIQKPVITPSVTPMIEINKKLKNATSVKPNGTKRINLDTFIKK